MMKEELKAIIEIAKEKNDPAILQSAVAKAEKEQLVEAESIAEATAQQPELSATLQAAEHNATCRHDARDVHKSVKSRVF